MVLMPQCCESHQGQLIWHYFLSEKDLLSTDDVRWQQIFFEWFKWRKYNIPPQNRKTCVLIVHCWHRKRSPSFTLGAGGSCRFIGPAFFYSFCFFESVLKTFNKEFSAIEKSEVAIHKNHGGTANAPLTLWAYQTSLLHSSHLVLPYLDLASLSLN